jgi:hypothetical protein
MTSRRPGFAITASSRGSFACIVAFFATGGCDGSVGKLNANVAAERCPEVSLTAQVRSGGLVPQVDQTCTLHNGALDAFLVVHQRQTVHGSTDPVSNITTTYRELTQINCRAGDGDCKVVVFRTGMHPGNIGIDDVLIMAGYQATIDGSKVVVARSASDRYAFDLGSREVTFTLLDPYLDRHGSASCTSSATFLAPAK